MNIDEIQLKGPELLVRMKEFGYAEATINQVKYGIHLILRIGGNPEYDSLDDIFTKYVLVNYAKSGIADKRFAFGMIKTYLETGLLLSEKGGKSGFQIYKCTEPLQIVGKTDFFAMEWLAWVGDND